MNDLERYLLGLLDGTRNRTELTEALVESVRTGNLRVGKQGGPVTDPAEARELIATILDPALDVIAKQALLVE